MCFLIGNRVCVFAFSNAYNLINYDITDITMEIRICECQKPLCRYRWIPRVKDSEPKECPSCKHQFSGCTWSTKAKCWSVTVDSMKEYISLKASIKKWNQEERLTAPY